MKALVLVAVCLVACVPPDSAGGGYAPPPAPAAYTCAQEVECLAGCGQDQPCAEECFRRGDDASRATVNALFACNAAASGSCEAELAACREQGQAVAQAQAEAAVAPEAAVGQPAPEAAPAVAEQMMPGQPHTTANLLPWLVGNWEGNNYHYTFHEDGRVRRASGVPLYTEKTGRYACASIVNETGTVTQEGDLLIMKFEAAQANHCGDATSAPALTVRNRIVWYQYNGPVELKLVDIDCTRGAMYCSDPIRRR